MTHTPLPILTHVCDFPSFYLKGKKGKKASSPHVLALISGLMTREQIKSADDTTPFLLPIVVTLSFPPFFMALDLWEIADTVFSPGGRETGGLPYVQNWDVSLPSKQF